MMPLYKILNPSITIIGYYYQYQTIVEESRYNTQLPWQLYQSYKAYARRTPYKKISKAEYLRIISPMPPHSLYDHFIIVDMNSLQQYCVSSEPKLCACTYCKDCNDRYIFEHDIVRIAHKGLLNSVGGIVYLDKYTMSYRVYLVHNSITKEWDEAIPLLEQQLEVIGNAHERVPLYKEFEGVKDYLFEGTSVSDILRIISGIEYYYNPVWKMFPIDENFDNNIVHYKAVCKVDYTDESNPEIPIIGGFPYLSNSVGAEKTKLLISRIHRIKEKKKNLPYDVAKRAYNRGVRPVVVRIDNASKIHRPIISFNTLAIKDSPTLFEDDLVINIKNSNIYGYIRYVPSKAAYLVEIPEELIARDSLFDGYMPFTEKTTRRDGRGYTVKRLLEVKDTNGPTVYPKF